MPLTLGVLLAGLQNHEVGFSRQGRFFGAATFTSDVRLYEVQYTREGDLKKVPKVMDLKKAHNGQVSTQSQGLVNWNKAGEALRLFCVAS